MSNSQDDYTAQRQRIRERLDSDEAAVPEADYTREWHKEGGWEHAFFDAKTGFFVGIGDGRRIEAGADYWPHDSAQEKAEAKRKAQRDRDFKEWLRHWDAAHG